MPNLVKITISKVQLTENIQFMDKIKILWADDEIDLLKPHVIFLEEKGYAVTAVLSGNEAIEKISEQKFDIVFLDENMPGLSGLETLQQIKEKSPSIPIIMITKSEEESIMEGAIGSKISDYLIKPVNPKQILLSIKKNLDSGRLVSEKTTMNYQQEFRNIGMNISNKLDYNEWVDIYNKLVYWELELEKLKERGMDEILKMQKNEANQVFCSYFENNYTDWLKDSENAPIMSHTVFRKKIAPHILNDSPLFLVVIDNLRLDQWHIIKPLINEHFWIDNEDAYYSIIPTTTQYARNSFFSGLLPSEIEKKYPDLWLNDEDEGGKNLHEPDLLEAQLKRLGKDVKHSYNKVLNQSYGRKLISDIPNMMQRPLNVIVYNFIDMLSHALTDTDIVRELAEDEAAYRSLTLNWFERSPLFEALKNIAARKGRVIITTDHGSVRVKKPIKIVGDKSVNSNLRYKQGKNLSYNAKEVFEIKNPADAFLPKVNVSQAYVFTREYSFFAYPNNYNHYVKYYSDTFQHGGISLEEIIIPVVHLLPK